MPVFFRPVHLRGPLRTSSIVPIQISVNSVPSLFQTGADCALRKLLTADAATQAHRALLPPPFTMGRMALPPVDRSSSALPDPNLSLAGAWLPRVATPCVPQVLVSAKPCGHCTGRPTRPTPMSHRASRASWRASERCGLPGLPSFVLSLVCWLAAVLFFFP